MAPIITDAPIILVAYYLLSGAKNIWPLIALVSLIGGVNLIFISKKLYNIRANDFEKPRDVGKSFWMAVRVNFLNPSPYLFWFTIGGSYLLRGTPVESGAFIVFSIGFLILSKVLVAFIALYFRGFLSSKGYTFVMKGLALLMAGFGLQLLFNALQIAGLGNYILTSA